MESCNSESYTLAHLKGNLGPITWCVGLVRNRILRLVKIQKNISTVVFLTISIKIGDIISSSFCVTSDIPQGSHFGSLIFLLFLNDDNLI